MEALTYQPSAKKRKRRRKKLIDSSPTSPVHKKPKKDPNKPEYPKVGMYCHFHIIFPNKCK